MVVAKNNIRFAIRNQESEGSQGWAFCSSFLRRQDLPRLRDWTPDESGVTMSPAHSDNDFGIVIWFKCEKSEYLENLSLDKKGYWSVDSIKSGRVAQGESTAFTRQGSEVQILSRLPKNKS